MELFTYLLYKLQKLISISKELLFIKYVNYSKKNIMEKFQKIIKETIIHFVDQKALIPTFKPNFITKSTLLHKLKKWF